MPFRTVCSLLLVLAGLLPLGCITHRAEGAYFESNGVRIHHTVEGDGEALILLHGFAANADLNWRVPGITRRLRRDFTVIATDHRGHGLSGKPHGKDAYGKEMAEDVIRLMDHLEIRQAHLVGYSMGGFVALHLLATHPERFLSGAVCAAGWERPEGERMKELLDVAEAFDAGEGFRPLFKKLDPDGKGPPRPAAWVAARVMRNINDTEVLGDILRSLPDLDIEEEQLRACPVPVLSIAGGNDRLKEGVDAMEGLIPNHTVVIVKRASHFTTLLHPAFRKNLRKFLLEHREARNQQDPEKG